MSIRSSATSSTRPSPLDIKRTPLKIPHLVRRQPQGSPVDRVRGEFAEMRGFSPTLAQCARLFDLPADECDRVLQTLIQDGSLIQDEDGRYRLR